MEFSISLQDNSAEVLNELDKIMPELLNATGLELYKSIYQFMTDDKIVDTGRLRGSISYSTPYNNYNNPAPANKPEDFIANVKEQDTVIYGSNVEYASYVNSGTSRQKARKFIENGTTRAIPQIKRVLQKILEGD